MTIVGTDLTVTIVVRKTFSSTEKEWANFLAMVQDSESHSRETQGEEGHLKAVARDGKKKKENGRDFVKDKDCRLAQETITDLTLIE